MKNYQARSLPLSTEAEGRGQTEGLIIRHIVRKPNSIIVLLFI